MILVLSRLGVTRTRRGFVSSVIHNQHVEAPPPPSLIPLRRRDVAGRAAVVFRVGGSAPLLCDVTSRSDYL